MTKNQKSALQEANDKRSRNAARGRILKALNADKISRGHAVLLLTSEAGMSRNRAVSVVTEVDALMAQVADFDAWLKANK